MESKNTENVMTVEIFKGATQETIFVCRSQGQYFAPDQTYDIHEHEYIKRYDTHFYHKIGEKNCRESHREIMFGKDGKPGYIFSLAKGLSKSYNLGELDSIIFTFSGYGDCTGETFIVSTLDYAEKEEFQQIVDDKELLFSKFKEAFPEHELNL
ncbi:hypothetical protein pEaSNUABM49_00414 [Erwinia phage pEa_SNUABM_49]|nr:hypothetical protein pEaSNUABM49_00414 [Erwinia phage pEa_SNUABM_49]